MKNTRNQHCIFYSPQNRKSQRLIKKWNNRNIKILPNPILSISHYHSNYHVFTKKKDHKWSSNVLVIVVMTKIAAAPIHRWFIDLIKTTRIKKSIFLMTWQKSIPLLIITITANELTWLFVVTSAILPTIEIINTLKTLEIFALSSVFNNSWLLTGRQLRTTITLVFTFLYWSAVISLMKEMKNRTSINSRTPSTGNVTITFLANLRSLPPTTGFAAKWLLSIKIIKTGLLTQTTALMLASLINIYSYIRLCSSNLTGVKNGKKKQKTYKQSYSSSFHIYNLYTVVCKVFWCNTTKNLLFKLDS